MRYMKQFYDLDTCVLYFYIRRRRPETKERKKKMKNTSMTKVEQRRLFNRYMLLLVNSIGIDLKSTGSHIHAHSIKCQAQTNSMHLLLRVSVL